MNRRSFLNRASLALGALLVAWGAPRLLACGRPGGPDPEQAARIAAVLEPLGGGTATSALAAAYLEQAPDEADRARLIARLCDGWTPEQLAASPERIVERVRRQHRDDFSAGRTTRLDGWILSLTEARVAALAHAS